MQWEVIIQNDVDVLIKEELLCEWLEQDLKVFGIVYDKDVLIPIILDTAIIEEDELNVSGKILQNFIKICIQII